MHDFTPVSSSTLSRINPLPLRARWQAIRNYGFPTNFCFNVMSSYIVPLLNQPLNIPSKTTILGEKNQLQENCLPEQFYILRLLKVFHLLGFTLAPRFLTQLWRSAIGWGSILKVCSSSQPDCTCPFQCD